MKTFKVQHQDIFDKLALKATPSVMFYKLDEDDHNVIDESLVGSKIMARKQPANYRNFKGGKKYDAEVVAVNEDGTLHLRYDDETVEDTSAPASLTDFGRDAGDKTDQLVAQAGQEPQSVVKSFTQMVERLMDTPEDETWREELIVGDLVDAAVDASMKCKAGHPLEARTNSHHSCDVCGKEYFELRDLGMKGTEYSCSVGCDYDMCDKCHSTMLGTSTEWYRGVVVGCGGTDVSIHFELLSNDKNTEMPWTSKNLKQRGTAGDYHYSKLKPNPEEEEDPILIALRGYLNSGLTEEQFNEKAAKWSCRPEGDATPDALDADLTLRLEREYQRSFRLGSNTSEVSYNFDDKDFTLDLLTMCETEVSSGATRKLMRKVSDQKEDPNDMLLAEYAQQVESGRLSESKEACTLVVNGLDTGEQISSIDEYKAALSRLKKRSDALLPDDGWAMADLRAWCTQNQFDAKGLVEGDDCLAAPLIDAIQTHLRDDEATGPLAEFDRCVEWSLSSSDEKSYFLEYPTADAANKARLFIQNQPAGLKSTSTVEYKFEANAVGQDSGFGSFNNVMCRYDAPDSTSKKSYEWLPPGHKLAALKIVASKSGKEGLYIQTDATKHQGNGDGEAAPPFYYIPIEVDSEGCSGTWVRHTASTTVASAEFLSALKMKSGTTWARISKHWKNMTLSHVGE